MDVKRNTEDNMKARIDIPLFCHHENMKLIYNGRSHINGVTMLLYFQVGLIGIKKLGKNGII